MYLRRRCSDGQSKNQKRKNMYQAVALSLCTKRFTNPKKLRALDSFCRYHKYIVRITISKFPQKVMNAHIEVATTKAIQAVLRGKGQKEVARHVSKSNQGLHIFFKFESRKNLWDGQRKEQYQKKNNSLSVEDINKDLR